MGFSLSTETKNFNRFIDKFMAKSSLSTDLVLKKFAFDLIKRIVKKNPVDTGRSRAAWYVSVEKLSGAGFNVHGIGMPPSMGTMRTYPEGVPEGRRRGLFKSVLGENIIKKWIEMINAVDYIIYLEYGSSRQAAFGMVRVSMREISGGKLPKEMGKRYKQDWNKLS